MQSEREKRTYSRNVGSLAVGRTCNQRVLEAMGMVEVDVVSNSVEPAMDMNVYSELTDYQQKQY